MKPLNINEEQKIDSDLDVAKVWAEEGGRERGGDPPQSRPNKIPKENIENKYLNLMRRVGF